MAYRGINSTPRTVQIFNGTAWVEYSQIRLGADLSAVSNTLWHKAAGNSIGYTGGNNFLEEVVHTLDNQGTATPLLSEEKRVVILEAADGTPVPYLLPFAVNGQEPAAEGTPDAENEQTHLVVEFTVSANLSGSYAPFAKYLVVWKYTGTYNSSTTVKPLTEDEDGFTVTSDTPGGLPDSQARLLIGRSGLVTPVRYFVDMDIKLFKYVPTP